MFRRIIPFFLLALIALMVSGAKADVDVDVNVNIGLPVVQISETPVMAVVPGTHVYFIFGHSQDLFFFGGHWWRAHNNRWYRAGHFNGPWKLRKGTSVPHPLLKLPPEWRRMNVVHSGLKYQEVKKNWKHWEKEKRWDKKEGSKGDNGQKMKDQTGQDKNGKEKPGKDGKGTKGRK